MLPQLQMKNQATNWQEKARYKIRNTVTHNGSYWVNSTGINTEPTNGSPNWIVAGSVTPISGLGNRTYKYIQIMADAPEIQDDELIGASEVTMITSTVAGIIMKSAITFVPVSGTIASFPVFVGDEFQIFFTKP